MIEFLIALTGRAVLPEAKCFTSIGYSMVFATLPLLWRLSKGQSIHPARSDRSPQALHP